MTAARITDGLLQLLAERRIFLSRDGSPRWKSGEVFWFHPEAVIEPYSQIYAGPTLPQAFGAFSYSHSNMYMQASVGRYCSLAQNISWMGGNHPTTWAGTSDVFYDLDAHPATRSYKAAGGWNEPVGAFASNMAPVTIGNDVWIGEEAMLGQGVTIGDGAIIGARALVLKDVPPYAIVVGQPARVLRYRFAEPLIARFIEAAWWRFEPRVVSTLPASEPERFLDAFAERLAKDQPSPMTPGSLTGPQIRAFLTGKAEPAG
jgi:acetyltransferase-like isoleucine patch superfamily enzyme